MYAKHIWGKPSICHTAISSLLFFIAISKAASTIFNVVTVTEDSEEMTHPYLLFSPTLLNFNFFKIIEGR